MAGAKSSESKIKTRKGQVTSSVSWAAKCGLVLIEIKKCFFVIGVLVYPLNH